MNPSTQPGRLALDEVIGIVEELLPLRAAGADQHDHPEQDQDAHHHNQDCAQPHCSVPSEKNARSWRAGRPNHAPKGVVRYRLDGGILIFWPALTSEPAGMLFTLRMSSLRTTNRRAMPSAVSPSWTV